LLQPTLLLDDQSDADSDGSAILKERAHKICVLFIRNSLSYEYICNAVSRTDILEEEGFAVQIE
jgi:hypothetical protein